MHIVTIKPETVFQAMADETRLRIIRLMVVSGEETCLCELVDSLNEPQTKLSRHLKVLRQAGLLSAQKEGRWIYHRLVTNVGYFEHLYQSVKAIPDELSIFKKDLKRFHNRLCLRENGRCKSGITGTDMKKDAMK